MEKMDAITILVLVMATVVNSTRIEITSSSSFRNGDESLTIFCEVSSTLGLDKITNIRLERNAEFLGSIDENGTKMGSETPSFSYEISGEFHPSSPTRSYLQLVIRNPSTEDQGTYECTTVGLEVKHITDTRRKYVRFKVEENRPAASGCGLCPTLHNSTLIGLLVLLYITALRG
ncbi:hypothetical protein SNE40_016240 [Patella caerulea]|uniref:Ig-like domain-containing protein n=1 Tax=Patella caerulea TaxID=87958 RepID=A0AAN8JCT1_PATCE